MTTFYFSSCEYVYVFFTCMAFCPHELGIRGPVLRTGDSNPGPCRTYVRPYPIVRSVAEPGFLVWSPSLPYFSNFDLLHPLNKPFEKKVDKFGLKRRSRMNLKRLEPEQTKKKNGSAPLFSNLLVVQLLSVPTE